MSDIDESYVIEQYSLNNKSTCQIAQELNTYPKKIERILKKNGQELRNKANAQSLALQSGRSKHPTSGKPRSEKDKNRIAESVHKRWQEMPQEQREEVSVRAKKRWDAIPEDKKREMQEMAGRALRQASVEGSKAENLLRVKLEKLGYEVLLHKTNLIPGDFEIDLFLPEIKTIIEIDGPQHFLPIWGEEKLQKTIRADEVKNGLLLSNGYCVIRIRYLCKHMSRSVGNKLSKLVLNVISKIANDFPPQGKRFIELEINNE